MHENTLILYGNLMKYLDLNIRWMWETNYGILSRRQWKSQFERNCSISRQNGARSYVLLGFSWDHKWILSRRCGLEIVTFTEKLSSSDLTLDEGPEAAGESGGMWRIVECGRACWQEWITYWQPAWGHDLEQPMEASKVQKLCTQDNNYGMKGNTWRNWEFYESSYRLHRG